MALRKNAKHRLLKQVPLFARCSGPELEAIGKIADELDFKEGKELAKEGAPGREFFVIVDWHRRGDARQEEAPDALRRRLLRRDLADHEAPAHGDRDDRLTDARARDHRPLVPADARPVAVDPAQGARSARRAARANAPAVDFGRMADDRDRTEAVRRRRVGRDRRVGRRALAVLGRGRRPRARRRRRRDAPRDRRRRARACESPLPAHKRAEILVKVAGRSAAATRRSRGRSRTRPASR